MLKKTELRDAAYSWIKALPHGRIFEHGDTYGFLEGNFADECRERGNAAREPRYRNDARWAAQDAKWDGLIRETGVRRGRFKGL
jgi:hypothetical protein